MRTFAVELLFTPNTESLRNLPEGPYRLANGRLSWVAIQHGPNEVTGSLNILDLATKSNKSMRLRRRPGFVFPTTDPNQFVIGLDRSIVLYNVLAGTVDPLNSDIDSQVDGTINNDGMVYGDYLTFGCKDLAFIAPKAGLYLMKPDRTLVRLADDQVCSNGKAIRVNDDHSLSFFDICSCSKCVTEWTLDLDKHEIDNWRTVVNLGEEGVFPDSMILTPDEQSVIVAIFNPNGATVGEARQYSIATGQLEAIWWCAHSPRVTCPQLIEMGGQVKLLLTTADEGMAPDLRAKNKNAGCTFVGDTEFAGLNDNPRFSI